MQQALAYVEMFSKSGKNLEPVIITRSSPVPVLVTLKVVSPEGQLTLVMRCGGSWKLLEHSLTFHHLHRDAFDAT